MAAPATVTSPHVASGRATDGAADAPASAEVTDIGVNQERTYPGAWAVPGHPGGSFVAEAGASSATVEFA